MLSVAARDGDAAAGSGEAAAEAADATDAWGSPVAHAAARDGGAAEPAGGSSSRNRQGRKARAAAFRAAKGVPPDGDAELRGPEPAAAEAGQCAQRMACAAVISIVNECCVQSGMFDGKCWSGWCMKSSSVRVGCSPGDALGVQERQAGTATTMPTSCVSCLMAPASWAPWTTTRLRCGVVPLLLMSKVFITLSLAMLSPSHDCLCAASGQALAHSA